LISLKQLFLNYKMETAALFRPVGPAELVLIKESGWKRFPSRLPEQPIFYPVLNEEYAIQINEQWNVPAYGSGYVTKFFIDKEYVKKYAEQNVGGEIHNELWIPAEGLEEFNNHIAGLIEITKEFHQEKE
jgi:hypothetical protein